MAESSAGVSSAPSSLPPPCPKSPPQYPDLYGKRREMAKVLMLEREIHFLEEELKFVEGLQPASRCCKEVSDFVVANSDPLIPTQRSKRRSCRFLKWLCTIPCLSLLRFCCCCHSECSCHLRRPQCCECNSPCNCCSCSSCFSCCPAPRLPSCSCFRSLLCCCCSWGNGLSCSRNCCCTPRCPSCSDSCCCRCKCKCSSCFRCPKVHLCCSSKNLCSDPCCVAF